MTQDNKHKPLAKKTKTSLVDFAQNKFIEEGLLTQCGTIALVGRPNVGKSTLINAILGQKVSITSNKAQTTRLSIRGIKTVQKIQYVYVDTPGVHQSKGSFVQKMMLREVTNLLEQVDLILFIVERNIFAKEDEWLLTSLIATKLPLILVINKVDMIKNKEKLFPILQHYDEMKVFTHIVPLSAQNHENVAALEHLIAPMIPFQPHFFSQDQKTDCDENFYISEIIREQIFRQTHGEIPYESSIHIEKVEDLPKLLRIEATIWVTRLGQKKIIIGAQGQQLKSIGRNSRLTLEKFFGKKIFLQLWVQVKKESSTNFYTEGKHRSKI